MIEHGPTLTFVCGFILFQVPFLFGKMSVYCTRWLKGWQIEREIFHSETVVGK